MQLFVYGTLVFPELQHALLGRKPNTIPAILKAYALHKIAYGTHESDYPLPKPMKDSSVPGYVLTDLSDAEMEILKFYEGEEYTLTEIVVTVEGKDLRVKSFFPSKDIRIDYEGVWDKTIFQENSLKHYLEIEIPRILSEMGKL